MPKLTIRNPKYCRHRAKNLAYVRLSGQVIYLGTWQSPESKAEYRRLLAVYHANGGRLPEESDCTIAELLDRYRVHCESHYRHPDGSPTGEAGNIGYDCRPLRELYGHTSASDFGPLDLQAVRQEMIGGRKWSRTHINAAIRRIVHSFKWAASQQLIPSATFESLRTVDGLKAGRSNARENKPTEAVDDAVVQVTLPHLPPVVADMVALQRMIGCRPGELCRMRPADIDRSRKDVWFYTPTRHKNTWRGKQRRIVIAGEDAQGILAKYLNRGSEAYCFSPAESVELNRQERSKKRTTPLAYGNKPGSNRQSKPKKQPGDRYDVRSYSRAIRIAAQRAGVPVWSANRLRHAAARDIQAAFGLEAAAAALGNSPEVCKMYAGANLSLAERVAIEMAQRRQSQSSPESAP